MAQEIVGIKIQVDGQEKVLSSMGEIRKELKTAQFDVLKFSEAFGASSKEAVAAAKRVAELKDAIGDAKDLVGAFNPDAKFRAFSGAVQGVAGGFAALQGAMGLVGVQGESVEKALLKVQSALALSEGLNSVFAAKDAFKNLGAVIQSTTVYQRANDIANKATAASMRLLGISAEATSTSFKVLKGAIVSTGIGVLVIALGEAVTAFQNYTSAADKAADAQKKLNENVKKYADIGLKAELTTIENQTKIQVAKAKAAGKSEKEIFEIEQSGRRLRIEAQQRYYKEVKNADANAASEAISEIEKTNTEGLVAQEEFNAKQREKRSQNSKDQKEKDKQLAKEREAAEKEAAERIVKLKGEIEVLGIKDEYDAKRKEIENQLAIDIKQVNDNEKLKSETKTALIKELERKAQADVVAVVKEEMDAANAVYTENQKKFTEDQRTLRQIELQDKLDSIDREIAKKDQDFEADQVRFEEKMAVLEEQKALELEAAENDEVKRNEIIKKYSDIRKGIIDDEVENEKKAHDAKVALQLQLLDTASSVIGGMGALFEQGSTESKVFALSDIAINTAKGYVQGLDIAQKGAAAAGPAAPFAFPIFYATQIAAVLGAVAKAKAVLTTAKGSGGGGGSVQAPNAAAPIAPVAPITNTVTQLDPQSINQMGNATNRAYVIESDVTNSQERIKRINRAARLT